MYYKLGINEAFYIPSFIFMDSVQPRKKPVEYDHHADIFFKNTIHDVLCALCSLFTQDGIYHRTFDKIARIVGKSNDNTTNKAKAEFSFCFEKPNSCCADCHITLKNLCVCGM